MDNIDIKMLKKVVDGLTDSPIDFAFYDVKKERGGPTKGAHLLIKDGKKVTESQRKAFRKDGKTKVGTDKLVEGTVAKVEGNYVFDIADDSKAKAKSLYIGAPNIAKAGVPKLVKEKLVIKLNGTTQSTDELNKPDEVDDTTEDLEDELDMDIQESKLGGSIGSSAKERVRMMLRKSVKERTLGSGTFGTVDLVKTADGLPLAVKTAKQIRYIKDLRKEAKIYEEIGEHPNIGKCYGIVEEGGTAKLVMKPIMGDDLTTCFGDINNALAGNIISQAEFEGIVSHLMRGMLRGLKAMSDAGYVHHDIKGQNVMLDLETMEPMLIDVGGATKTGERGYSYTRGYTDHQSLDEKADVFAVGSTTYRAREGEGLMKKAYKYFGHIVNEQDKKVQASWAIARGQVKPVEVKGNKNPTEKGEVGLGGHTLAYVKFQIGMMDPNEKSRFTLDEALAHPFIGDPAVGSEDAKEALKKVTGRRSGKRDRLRELLQRAQLENPDGLNEEINRIGAATRLFPIEAKRTCADVAAETLDESSLDGLLDRVVELAKRIDHAEGEIQRYRILLNQLAAEGSTGGMHGDNLRDPVDNQPRFLELYARRVATVRAMVEAVKDGSWEASFAKPPVEVTNAATIADAKCRLWTASAEGQLTAAQKLSVTLVALAKQDSPDVIDVADVHFCHDEFEKLLPKYRAPIAGWEAARKAAAAAYTLNPLARGADAAAKQLGSRITEYKVVLGQLENLVIDGRVQLAKLGRADGKLLEKKRVEMVNNALGRAKAAWASALSDYPELATTYDYGTLPSKLRRGMTTLDKLNGDKLLPEKQVVAMTEALREANTICKERMSGLVGIAHRLNAEYLTLYLFLEEVEDTDQFDDVWPTIDSSVSDLDGYQALMQRVTTLQTRYEEIDTKIQVGLGSKNAARGDVLAVAHPIMQRGLTWKSEASDWLANFLDLSTRIAGAKKLASAARTRRDEAGVREALSGLPVWCVDLDKADREIVDARSLSWELRGLARYKSEEYSFVDVAAKLGKTMSTFTERAGANLAPCRKALSQMIAWQQELPVRPMEIGRDLDVEEMPDLNFSDEVGDVVAPMPNRGTEESSSDIYGSGKGL